jgi:hypothetical protein
MKVRLTELSIISMHMKTTIAFRRVRAPITPMVKSIPLKTKKHSGGMDGIVINYSSMQHANSHPSLLPRGERDACLPVDGE